jgi:hypothetical protein
MLNLVGSTGCLAALVPLLEDDRQADRARYALEIIHGPAIDAAFRNALPRLHGAAKAGLIGSLAVRGDREAVEALKGIEADATEPAEVRQAAARALAHLNSDR